MPGTVSLLELNTWWAMQGIHLQGFRQELAAVRTVDVEARGEVKAAERAGLPVQAKNGIATISVGGPLTKTYGLMAWLFGGTSYLAIKAAINAAASDASVRRILLRVNSPGGSVMGMADAGDAIAAAAKVKPITAWIDDIGASAAYYLASQATEIYASRMAEVGSIGVYAVLYDTSKQAEQNGVRVIEATTGKLKMIGVPGVEITKEMEAEVQKHISAWGDEFVSAVSRGRGMPVDDVKKWATGATFHAQEAVGARLIDGVLSYEAALAMLSEREQMAGRARTARANASRMAMDV